MERIEGLMPLNAKVKRKDHIYLINSQTKVLQADDSVPALTVCSFGNGFGIYMGGYEMTAENIRMLENLILFGSGGTVNEDYITDNLYTECTYFKENNTLVVINNSEKRQETKVMCDGKGYEFTLKPYEMLVRQLK